MQRIASLALALFLVAPAAARAGSLDILLSNDDGWDAAGIQAQRAALCAAGHHVTLVAPATDQSGKGGSLNTNVLDFTPGVGLMALIKRSSDACGDVWSLDGTPADSVRAGLMVLLAASPPDLVVTGLNRGQNMSKPTSNTSGTVAGALTGGFEGIPAIAGSVGILFSESSSGFPSTAAAYAPAADFVVRAIADLQRVFGARLLPPGVTVLNVNFPVPYGDTTGVDVTRLADRSDLELPLFDPSQGFPSLGVPPLPFPSCQTSPQCFVAVGVAFPPGPDAVRHADTDAFRAGRISITPMDGDMTVGPLVSWAIGRVLGDLQP